MADKSTISDRFAREPTKTQSGSDSNRHECLEPNLALSGLNAEDVGR